MGSFWGGLVGGAVLRAVLGLAASVPFEGYLISKRERFVRVLSVRLGRIRLIGLPQKSTGSDRALCRRRGIF